MTRPAALVAPIILLALVACGPGNSPRAAVGTPTPAVASPGAGSPAPIVGATAGAVRGGRGIPSNTPWATLYGAAPRDVLVNLAARLHLVVVDADAGNVSRDDVALLHGNGATVISYLDVGSCEKFRKWWTSAPPGFVPCGQNSAAQRGPYHGYPDEVWMDPGNPDYQHLLVDLVAPGLDATGIDGFFIDNLEIVEHGQSDSEGPCDARCAQGGLDLVYALRQRFPERILVMQNATGTVTREGSTHGVKFVTLLDGISHEQVFAPEHDAGAEAELLAWKALGLRPGGRPFSITTEDYVGSCDNRDAAARAFKASRADGFSPYATDASAGQKQACLWPG